MNSHNEQSFVSKYIFSIDHKVIGKQFLWLGIFFLLFGGFQAMLIRWSLSNTMEPLPWWLLGGYFVSKLTSRCGYHWT